jgi:hypothetical protein
MPVGEETPSPKHQKRQRHPDNRYASRIAPQINKPTATVDHGEVGLQKDIDVAQTSVPNIGVVPSKSMSVREAVQHTRMAGDGSTIQLQRAKHPTTTPECVTIARKRGNDTTPVPQHRTVADGSALNMTGPKRVIVDRTFNTLVPQIDGTPSPTLRSDHKTGNGDPVRSLLPRKNVPPKALMNNGMVLVAESDLVTTPVHKNSDIRARKLLSLDVATPSAWGGDEAGWRRMQAARKDASCAEPALHGRFGSNITPATKKWNTPARSKLEIGWTKPDVRRGSNITPVPKKSKAPARSKLETGWTKPEKKRDHSERPTPEGDKTTSAKERNSKKVGASGLTTLQMSVFESYLLPHEKRPKTSVLENHFNGHDPVPRMDDSLARHLRSKGPSMPISWMGEGDAYRRLEHAKVNSSRQGVESVPKNTPNYKKITDPGLLVMINKRRLQAIERRERKRRTAAVGSNSIGVNVGHTGHTVTGNKVEIRTSLNKKRLLALEKRAQSKCRYDANNSKVKVERTKLPRDMGEEQDEFPDWMFGNIDGGHIHQINMHLHNKTGCTMPRDEEKHGRETIEKYVQGPRKEHDEICGDAKRYATAATRSATRADDEDEFPE